MFAGLEESAKDGAALPSLLEADTLQMLKEYPFGFADILPRDGELIVDSILQHGVQEGKK